MAERRCLIHIWKLKLLKLVWLQVLLAQTKTHHCFSGGGEEMEREMFWMLDVFLFGWGGGGDFVSFWYVFWRFELEEVMMV